jgi:hypothetical protein
MQVCVPAGKALIHDDNSLQASYKTTGQCLTESMSDKHAIQIYDGNPNALCIGKFIAAIQDGIKSVAMKCRSL